MGRRGPAPVPISERFWTKVDKTDDCWLWTAACTHDGYGFIALPGRYTGNVYAHRWAYEHLVGPIPDGLQLDHLCRVRNCVNPDHLEPVTPRENTRRGGRAQRTHCPQGHPYDEANTHIGPDGHRNCRACGRESATTPQAGQAQGGDAMTRERPELGSRWSVLIGPVVREVA